jgi:hypothetical protein
MIYFFFFPVLYIYRLILMNELEVAILVVLILIVIVLVWVWHKNAFKNCLSNLDDETKRMLASKYGASKYGGMTTLNRRVASRDGYSDMDERAQILYDQASGVTTHPSANPDFDISDEYLKGTGLNHGVLKGHQEYLKDALTRSSTASLQSIRDDYTPVNSWMGLRRAQMQIAKPEPGARTVPSEDAAQDYPGDDLRWGTAEGL